MPKLCGFVIGVVFMEKFDKNAVSSAAAYANELADEINSLTAAKLSDFDKDKTVLALVDIINGFIREGAMHSDSIEGIIEPSAKLLSECGKAGIAAFAFADCHEKGCAEFASFPEHCVKGTSESEIVDELKSIGGYMLIEKNSTNGCHEESFRAFLDEHKQADTFIVCGDCTDICVLQFCLSLKTLFNKENKPLNIIVPINAVETYDAPYHNAAFANLAAYKLMKDCGVRFVSAIE